MRGRAIVHHDVLLPLVSERMFVWWVVPRGRIFFFPGASGAVLFVTEARCTVRWERDRGVGVGTWRNEWGDGRAVEMAGLAVFRCLFLGIGCFSPLSWGDFGRFAGDGTTHVSVMEIRWTPLRCCLVR